MRMTYSPLDTSKREIRVLILEPGKWHDEIRSTLKAVSLDEGSDYQTLSYVWGDPTETVKYEFPFVTQISISA